MGVRLFSPRSGTRSGNGESARRYGYRAGREAAAVLLAAAACYLCLALASLETLAADGNWVGPVGAWLAELLVGGFGVVAWLLPLELVLIAAPLFQHRELQPLGLRLSGNLALGIVVASLVHVALPDTTIEVALPAGGNVGLFFGELMRASFSTVGSFLVGATLVALLLIARSAFSFIEWCERVVEVARRLRGGCSALLARVRQAWLEARALRRSPLVAATANTPALAGGAGSGRREDGYASWQPREITGIPPLAVSAALRSGLGIAVEALLEADESGPAAASEPSPAPRRARARASAAPPASTPAAPPARPGRVRMKPTAVPEAESDAVFEAEPVPTVAPACRVGSSGAGCGRRWRTSRCARSARRRS
jgi:S-DNA-T family DNA segregation ATPase FtsK/SpoIIIE